MSQLQNVRPVVRVATRLRPVAPNLTTVANRNRNQLAAYLQQQERAGRIKRIGVITVNEKTRVATASFIRLKPEPKRWPWAVAGTLLTLGGMTMIGWMIWDAARVLAQAAGAVLVIGVALW